MRWLRKNKLQLEQGSSVSEASGQYEKTWSRCARLPEVLSCCPAFVQEISGTSSGSRIEEVVGRPGLFSSSCPC